MCFKENLSSTYRVKATIAIHQIPTHPFFPGTHNTSHTPYPQPPPYFLPGKPIKSSKFLQSQPISGSAVRHAKTSFRPLRSAVSPEGFRCFAARRCLVCCRRARKPCPLRQSKTNLIFTTMAHENALALAGKYGLESLIEELIQKGYTPEEALSEWDII